MQDKIQHLLNHLQIIYKENPYTEKFMKKMKSIFTGDYHYEKGAGIFVSGEPPLVISILPVITNPSAEFFESFINITIGQMPAVMCRMHFNLSDSNNPELVNSAAWYLPNPESQILLYTHRTHIDNIDYRISLNHRVYIEAMIERVIEKLEKYYD